jgi:hypothetical protein
VVFRNVARFGQIRRFEKLPLQLAADLVHGAGTDCRSAQRMRDRLQKRVPEQKNGKTHCSKQAIGGL